MVTGVVPAKGCVAALGIAPLVASELGGAAKTNAEAGSPPTVCASAALNA